MNITHATIEGDTPVAIFEPENEFKMKCIWANPKAKKEHQLWNKGRAYRITPDGEYKKLGLKRRDTTDEEMVGIELEKKLEEKE
jgi:hypothetical protein